MIFDEYFILASSLQIAHSINNILVTYNFKSFKANANNLRNLRGIHTVVFKFVAIKQTCFQIMTLLHVQVNFTESTSPPV